MSVVRALVGATFVALVTSHRADAQVIQGFVRDTTARQPVVGAVVLLLDSAGNALRRNISDEAGRYRITSEPLGRKLRFLRIGFRPREVVAPETNGGTVDLDVAMVALPTMLEMMKVTSGAKCSARDDRMKALSLLDQARAGLLATVVAREAKPAEMIRVRYGGTIEARSDRPLYPVVRIDSSADVKASFQAVRTPADFVTQGFLDTTRSADVLYGPDAETLLDDAFSNGYCFELRKRDSKRPNSVGLGFVPSTKQKGRIDIDGTLWIDTLRRRLEDIQFKYVGLEGDLTRLNLGGQIHFHEVDNGVVLIDRWSLRVPTLVSDTVVPALAAKPIVRRQLTIQESGGAVASAQWPEGFRWTAKLLSARLRIVDDALQPLAGAVVSLEKTPYRAVSDDNGIASITRMLPGWYRGVATDPVLEALGVKLTTPLTFLLENEDTATTIVKAPSSALYVQDACRKVDETAPIARNGSWFIARVVDLDDRPIKLAEWRATRSVNGEWKAIANAQGLTSTAGLLQYCGGELHAGDEVRLESRWSLDDPWHPITFRLKGRVTALVFKLPLRDGFE